MLLGLIGCNRQTAPTANDANLTTRSGADPMSAVETYLQQYQPGPLPRLFQTTRIYDRHGELLAELMDEGQRTWVSVDQVARDLLNATVATEDASFFANSGVDPVRMVGAVVRSAQEGEITSGASTITMQLARNLFLGPEQRYDQSVDRKLLEIGLAQELTQLYSKAELLEMYLNLQLWQFGLWSGSGGPHLLCQTCIGIDAGGGKLSGWDPPTTGESRSLSEL
ncbi:MAG: biosynthetic peptidoglycan transglycosylase [Caldilineaceae bacterium]